MTLKDLVILSTALQALYLDEAAGVELLFESQRSGQGTPRVNVRGVQYVKPLRGRFSAHSVFLFCFGFFSPFTSTVLCIDSWADLFLNFKKREVNFLYIIMKMLGAHTRRRAVGGPERKVGKCQ